MNKILIAGGGAAGMMAAVSAARNGSKVELFEKNDRLGRKLFITGKGRCNITNTADTEEMLRAVMSNPKFLYSGFYSFTNEQTVDFFEEIGVRTKEERGGRVFPMSDHSSDVIRALEREMRRLGVRIHLNQAVESLLSNDDGITGIRLVSGEEVNGDAVILTTGGISYPSTGSTGDGYRMASAIGHRITPLFPSLVPMSAKEAFVSDLMGLSLRNVEVWITDGKKCVYREFGEMLFTHYGVSGPIILSASSVIGKKIKDKELVLHIDLKPALDESQLDKRLIREFESNQNKQFKNAVDSLFPAKLRPVIVSCSGIKPDKKVNEITREERLEFARKIKDFQITLTGLRGYNEAIITKGGISVKEVDPGTMESKLVHGLYIAGEILDLDALTGGYNLQIAWSTGWLAGTHASGKV